MNIILVIVIAIVALIVGAMCAIFVTRRNAKSQANSILEKATLEAEVLKNNEVIKGKEMGFRSRAKPKNRPMPVLPRCNRAKPSKSNVKFN